MAEPYYKTSKITGRTYDLFNCVHLLNIRQICAYIRKNVPIEDIEVSEDKNKNPMLVFIFDKTLSKNAYDEWCKNKPDKKETT